MYFFRDGGGGGGGGNGGWEGERDPRSTTADRPCSARERQIIAPLGEPRSPRHSRALRRAMLRARHNVVFTRETRAERVIACDLMETARMTCVYIYTYYVSRAYNIRRSLFLPSYIIHARYCSFLTARRIGRECARVLSRGWKRERESDR